MFYSQTFLARKGPLGTVWCAAHLQHRLKKSHYTSTDIITTVDQIMCPEVPIALRISGHLLLGVARIYSKKVEYLFHDCNVALVSLRKAFATTVVDLPENARQAPLQSITLPQTFDLDALNLDDDTYMNGTPDAHLRSQEEITLTDQIPLTERDPYVVITFDDDIMTDFLHPMEVSDSGVLRSSSVSEPMNEDALPPLDSVVGNPTEAYAGSIGPKKDSTRPNAQTEVHDVTMEFQDPGPDIETEILYSRPDGHTSPQSIPEMEIMRDAVPEVSAGTLPPLSLIQENIVPEPNSDEVLKYKDILSPSLEDVLTPGGKSLEFQLHSDPSEEGPGISETRLTFGHSSPNLAMQPTPPVQLPKRRWRKRKLFDEETVLNNKFMKKALENCSDLLRKKRKLPCSSLDVWKFNNSIGKEQIFHGSSLTGLCSDMCNMFQKDYFSTKPHLLISDEPSPGFGVAQSPNPEDIPESMQAPSPAPAAQSPNPEDIPDSMQVQSPGAATEAIPNSPVAQSDAPTEPMEIESLRDAGYKSNFNYHDFMPPPSPTSDATFAGSSFRRDSTPPFSIDSAGLDSVPWSGTTITTEFPELSSTRSGRAYGSDFETPRTSFEKQLGMENSRLPDIPEHINYEEAGDLDFLEADNGNTVTGGTPGSQGVESLSARARAVAQYLQRQSSSSSSSPMTPASKGSSAYLSLNKMLEGKSRKLCARMFFETLVLKSVGLVEVEQKEASGDIMLKLSKTNI